MNYTLFTYTSSAIVGSSDGTNIKWWWAFIPVICVLPVVALSVGLLVFHYVYVAKKNAVAPGPL